MSPKTQYVYTYIFTRIHLGGLMCICRKPEATNRM